MIAKKMLSRHAYPTNLMAICQVNTNKRPSRHEKYLFLRHLGFKKSDATLPCTLAFNFVVIVYMRSNYLNVRTKERKENKLEDKFLNGFETKVNKYLIGLQNSGDETYGVKRILFYSYTDYRAL